MMRGLRLWIPGSGLRPARCDRANSAITAPNFLRERAMHDIKWIRENPQAFDRGLKRRSLPAQSKELIALDEKRRAAIMKAEAAQARRNAASKEIGAAKKNKDEASAQALMAEVAAVEDTMPAVE